VPLDVGLVAHAVTEQCLSAVQGYTLLHLAAQTGHGQIVKLLLMHGAKVDVRDAKVSEALWSLAIQTLCFFSLPVLHIVEHASVVSFCNALTLCLQFKDT